MNFWLDGHYSGAGTFLSEEAHLSPILEEVKSIVESLDVCQKYVIAIDDARLFEGPGSGYPSVSKMKEFAAENDLDFSMSDDIFLMKNFRLD